MLGEQTACSNPASALEVSEAHYGIYRRRRTHMNIGVGVISLRRKWLVAVSLFGVLVELEAKLDLPGFLVDDP
jgi:hypothetical protein